MNGSDPAKRPNWVESLLSDPLELPDGSNFESTSPSLSYQQMLELSEKYLVTMNSRPDFIESRIRRDFLEPFEL